MGLPSKTHERSEQIISLELDCDSCQFWGTRQLGPETSPKSVEADKGVAAFIGLAAEAKPIRLESTRASALHTLSF